MRKTRFIENCRCYHLISRLAHQAFFLDDDEKTRAVELLRRVEEFSIHFNRYYLSRCWRRASLLEPIPTIRSRPSRGIA